MINHKKIYSFASMTVDELTQVYPISHTHLTIHLIHFQFIVIWSTHYLSYKKVIRKLTQCILMLDIVKQSFFHLSYNFMQWCVSSPWRIEFFLRYVISPAKSCNDCYPYILCSSSWYFFLFIIIFVDINTTNVLNYYDVTNSYRSFFYYLKSILFN